MRSARFGGLVKSEPRLLYYEGQFLHDALRRERVTEDEVLAAVREQGVLSLDDVAAVVLETASTLSVLRKSASRPSALEKVTGAPQ